MSLRRDFRHGLRIGRAEFVRSLRGYLGETRRLVGLAVVVLFFGGNFLFALPTAYLLGLTARSVAEIPFFGPAATAVPVGFVLLATLRTLERIGSVEAEEFVLLAVHPRAVVVGLITAEVARLALWFGVPLGAFVVAFALGLGTPVVLLMGVVVGVPLVVSAAVWGYALGIATLRVLRRLPSVRRLLKALGVLAMVGLVLVSQFVGRYVAEEGVSVRGVLSAFTFDPIVEYVALALVGTPLARPPSAQSVAVFAALVALVPVGLAVATRQASKLWFTDAPSRNRQERTSSGGFTPPRPFAWRKAGRVAWSVLVRAKRRPQEFTHLLMAVFFVGPLGTVVVQSSGDALAFLVAGTGVGLGTYLAGATFGLNPLGDDRPQFPLLLLAETSPRTVVRGRVLAGLAVGLPFAVLVPVGATLLGAGLGETAVFAFAGAGMCVAASAFAVGVGSAYPIYEEREVWGTESVVPSTLVMVAYLFVVAGGTAIGLGVAWFGLTGNLVFTPLFAVAIAVYLLMTVGVPYGSYRYAVRRYRRYTWD